MSNQPPHTDNIPEPTISRLPWYLAYVNRLNESGVENVSSTQISRQLNVEASQIAKDLSYLGIRGKTRIGYEVKALLECLSDFLGFKRSHRAIIAGIGSLGSALIADNGLQRFGLDIVAGIDVAAEKVGRSIGGVQVHHFDDLRKVIKATKAEIGIITVPVECAQLVADAMSGAGINALWNFTPTRIVARKGIIVQDTSIYAHLAVMYHRLHLYNEAER